MIIVRISLREALIEISNKKWFFCNYGELEVLEISYTLFGVSSIETKHFSVKAGWHSVKDDLQYAYFLRFEGTRLRERLSKNLKSGFFEHVSS
jgi:hypothetical protein